MNEFPRDFLFGAATSAHQVEGNNINSDWWDFEQDPQAKKKNPKLESSGAACDQWNRYEQDFDLARELGHNAHRFSIEWARIEPEEGRFDGFALKHYQKMLEALRSRGISPMVTLHHFTNPKWFSQKGGWQHKDAPDLFGRYVSYVIERLHPLCNYWMPINEPSVLVDNGYLKGEWPPQKRNIVAARRAAYNFLAAHKKAYSVIKRHSPQSRVGFVAAIAAFLPKANVNPFDKAAKAVASYFGMHFWLSRVRYASDFIGLNYYRSFAISLFPPFVKELGEEKSDIGWGIYPKGLGVLLRELSVYRMPIIITENGLADESDQKRPRFIVEHLREVLAARQQGVDVRGYLYWSLLDNFEWAYGFKPRFGLVGVDYKTQERRIRPSARLFAEIIKTRRLGLVDKIA